MSESGLEKEIIVDINPYQTRVVLLEQGTPARYSFAADRQCIALMDVIGV